uniref:RHOMBOID-like protein n=1 Tax=Tetraselmis sp. GSL018 TaxID=582737 RepID=A0A061RCH9_9CHLO
MGGRSAWAAAVTTIITSSMMVRFAETMADRGAPPDERLYAVIRLECLLHDNPYKRRAITVLTSLIKGKRPTLGERLQVEVIITGERMLAWFTPAAMDHHRLYFSVAYMLVIVTTFFFMAGEYSVYSAIESGEEVKYGPHELMDLVSLQSSLETVFSREFLWEWGGRDAPGLMEAGGWTRWCTSVLLHNTFQHMLSNLLLTLALAFHLESKYGAWRISLLWVLSSSGGQLMSALFEDPCHLVVGASGGVFGMMGLFVADMVVNFQTIKRPILRCLLIIIFGIFFTVTLVNTDNVSHASHAGGLVCGLFLSFLFLPRLRVGYRWELILPALGACVLLAVFVCVPPYIYEVRYSEVVC